MHAAGSSTLLTRLSTLKSQREFRRKNRIALPGASAARCEPSPPLLGFCHPWSRPELGSPLQARSSTPGCACAAHRVLRRDHCMATAPIGLLLLTVGNGGLAWAEQRVPSGSTALIVAIMPLWMVLFDWL